MLSAWLGLSVAGCSEEAGAAPSDVAVPETYVFESRFEPNQSSVAYSGQTLRHVLIKAIDEQIEELTEQIDKGELKPEPGDVRKILESYYAFDSKVTGSQSLPMETKPPLLQSTYDELATGKDLKGKFAGNGGETEHTDWKNAFVGVAGQNSAESFLLSLFDRLDELAVARARGQYEVDAATPVYVTADGLDLKEMIEKLLLVGVAYSQVVDKYLDEELESTDNAQLAEGGKVEPYSALEHAWDEGFGYFGAPRDYGAYSDAELAAGTAKDTNADGKLDVMSEMAFAPAVYAGKRDAGSKKTTDFTADLWNAFRKGRAILAAAGDRLTPDQQASIFEQRDLAVSAFENVLAANTVHYLNDTLKELAEAQTGQFELTELAAHFSEMKAFSLGLQLHPRSRLLARDFADFHAKIGSRPVLPDEGAEAVKAFTQRLLEARALLHRAYGFAGENMGDDSGQGGW